MPNPVSTHSHFAAYVSNQLFSFSYVTAMDSCCIFADTPGYMQSVISNHVIIAPGLTQDVNTEIIVAMQLAPKWN